MASRSMAALALVTILLVSVLGVAAVGGAVRSDPASARPTVAAGAAIARAPAPAVPRALGASPLPVGADPDSVLVDSTNGTAFVGSEYGNNVTAIDLATGKVSAVIPVGSEPYPEAIALDTTNWTVYVVNSGSENVSVISIGEEAVVASVPVGAGPDAVAVNPSNHDVYVANGGDGTVSIISPATTVPRVIATVPVGADPDGIAIDTVTHNVFVADAGTDNISVISGHTNTVIKTVGAGTGAGAYGAIAYDPATNDVYVANPGSNNVSVIGGSNFTDFASVPVGSGPSGLVVDAVAKEVFVANRFSGNVTAFVAANRSIVANLAVGAQPGTQNAIAVNPKTGIVYVANAGSDNVSLISPAAKKVIATEPVGELPEAIGADPTTGTVVVANSGAASVSVFLLSAVSFRASGLPAGSAWSVTVGAPPTTVGNVTHKSKGEIALYLPAGNDPYAVTAPAGYALSKVRGPLDPSQHAVNVTVAPATFTLVFGPIETLTFEEVGLPNHAAWSIALRSPLAYGGPSPQSAASTSTTIAFTVVKDDWKFTLTTSPASYRPSASHGTVSVGSRATTHTIRFKAITAAVLFEEAGLAAHTSWEVSITGPMDVNATSTGTSIAVHLIAGTYDYTIENFSALHPFPVTGTFTVVAPHATPIVISISYSATPAHAAPTVPPGAAMPVAAGRPLG